MSLTATIKSIQNEMRKDEGVGGDDQRIEQLAWMLFLKIYDAKEAEWEFTDRKYKSPVPEKLKWRNWAADPEGMTGEALLDFVNNTLFPGLQNLAVGKEDGRARIVREVFEGGYNFMRSGQQLRKIINKLEEIDFNSLKERQHFGDIYEKILSDLQSAGNSGEFYTPRAVTQFMADRIDPRPGETLLDPACGTGGFLTCAINHMRKHHVKGVKDERALQSCLRGVEKKHMPHLLCMTNLLLHDIADPGFVRHDNTLARPYTSWTKDERVDIVLTNPPFGGKETDGIETNFPKAYQTRETADLFLALIIRLLKPGGRCAIVLPDGTLFGEGVKTRLKEALLTECDLHTIVRLSGGMTPSKAKPEFWDGQINWFSSKDVKPDELITSELKITREGVDSTSLQLYSPGCLVMVARSGILKHTFPVSILRVEGTVNQDLKVLSPFIGGLERYLQIMLRGFNGFIINSLVKTGMTVQSLKFDEFIIQPFPLPPLAEQKRIVAKVDELMALCDRLETEQQERQEKHAALARASLARFAEAPTPANLNLLFHKSYDIAPADLRKTILTLAVQGKLVKQDPKDEPAGKLLERIDKAPKRLMRTRSTEEGEGDTSSDIKPLFDLPNGWEWAQFRRLPLFASVGIDRGRSLQGQDKAYGYFKMNNIRNSGGIDLSDLTRVDATDQEVETFALTDGDFLFNTRNSRELVGKTCVYRAPSADTVLYNNNILRAKFIEGFSPDFLDYWFRSPQGNQELEKLKSNTTNVCAIYQGKLSGFPCPIPPLAEQRRIVAKVDELMALVDALETQLATARTSATHLLEALVMDLSNNKTNVQD